MYLCTKYIQDEKQPFNRAKSKESSLKKTKIEVLVVLKMVSA